MGVGLRFCVCLFHVDVDVASLFMPIMVSILTSSSTFNFRFECKVVVLSIFILLVMLVLDDAQWCIMIHNAARRCTMIAADSLRGMILHDDARGSAMMLDDPR